jgi:hypothetical protein
MATPSTESPDPTGLRARLRGSGPSRHRRLPRRCFAVHYRAPVELLATLVPPGAELDPVGRTGFGLLTALVSSDRRSLSLLGPSGGVVHRLVVRPGGGEDRCAAWILRSDFARSLAGHFTSHFTSHFKGAARFEHVEDGERWTLSCMSRDPLGAARFEVRLEAIDKQAPEGSIFDSARELWEHAFELEGTCAYDAGRDRLVFRPREVSERDLSFCHDFAAEFGLVRTLERELGIPLELDCASQLHDVRAVRSVAPARRAGVGRVARLPSGA